MNKIPLLTGLTLAALALPAAAVITYVDADLSNSPSNNTIISGGTAIATGNLGGWDTRGAGAVVSDGSTDGSNFGNNGNVLQGDNAVGADAELTTTVTGLDALLSYEVFVFFWDDQASAPTTDANAANHWDVDAGLATGSLSGFSPTNSVLVDATTAANISGLNVLGQGTDDFTDFVDGNRTLFYASVGIVPAGSTDIDVFVRNSDRTVGQRTWYDGVGVQAVPEPSHSALIALGGLGLILRRRR